MITKAHASEKTNNEEAVMLYKKAITLLIEIDKQCEKYFSTWRRQKFPINRLSLVLERQGRYQECVDEINNYEKMIDKIGLRAREKESVEKRKKRIERKLRAINKPIQ